MLQSDSFDLMPWAPKNWCFQILVLEKTLENPFQLQRDQTSQSSRKSTLNIHWKDWCWNSSSNTLTTNLKSWLIGKYPDAGKYLQQEENGVTEPEMVGWHHQLNEHEFEETGKWRTGKPGVLQSMEVQIAGHNLVTKQQGLSPNLKSTVSNKYEAKSSKYLNDNFTSLECSIISWLYGCYCYLLAVTSSSCNPVDDM